MDNMENKKIFNRMFLMEEISEKIFKDFKYFQQNVYLQSIQLFICNLLQYYLLFTNSFWFG